MGELLGNLHAPSTLLHGADRNDHGYGADHDRTSVLLLVGASADGKGDQAITARFGGNGYSSTFRWRYAREPGRHRTDACASCSTRAVSPPRFSARAPAKREPNFGLANKDFCAGQNFLANLSPRRLPVARER